MRVRVLVSTVVLLILIAGCALFQREEEYQRFARAVWDQDGTAVLLLVWRFETRDPAAPWFDTDGISSSWIDGYLLRGDQLEGWRDGAFRTPEALRREDLVLQYRDTTGPGVSFSPGLAGEVLGRNVYLLNRGGAGYRVFIGSGFFPSVWDIQAGTVSTARRVLSLPRQMITPLLESGRHPQLEYEDFWPLVATLDMLPTRSGERAAILTTVGYYPDAERGALGPQYFNHVITLFDAATGNAISAVRMSEDAPSSWIDSGGTVTPPEEPDSGEVFPIYLGLGGHGPFDDLLPDYESGIITWLTLLETSGVVGTEDAPAERVAIVAAFAPEGEERNVASVAVGFPVPVAEPQTQPPPQRESWGAVSAELIGATGGRLLPHPSGPVNRQGELLFLENGRARSSRSRARIEQLDGWQTRPAWEE